MSQFDQIFMDESGYTGFDLFSDDQRFLSVSTIKISEEEAKRLINAHFPRRQFAELKYSKVRRRQSYWKALLDIQKILLSDYQGMSYIINKRYALTYKIIDICLEPFYRSIGIDLNMDGQIFALASLVFVTAPTFWGKENFLQWLLLFQNMVRTKSPSEIKAFFQSIHSLPRTELDDPLKPLLIAEPIITQYITEPNVSTDISFAPIIGLLSQLEIKNLKSYEIIHDQTKNFESYRRVIDLFLSKSVNHEFRFSVHSAIKFPLKLKQISQIDSIASCGVQLADILAGGAVDCAYSQFGGSDRNAYNENILNLYGDDNIFHLFPVGDADEAKQRYHGNQSTEFIDFISKR